MSGWQSIETAPKDGTDFLAYDPVAKEYDVCFWHKTFLPSPRSCQFDREWGQLTHEFNHDRATHWMPLPAPPSLSEAGDAL